MACAEAAGVGGSGVKAYRFHIAHPTAHYDPAWGRVVTLCHKDYPETYVLDAPVEGLPMCTVCVQRHAERPVHSGGRI